MRLTTKGGRELYLSGDTDVARATAGVARRDPRRKQTTAGEENLAEGCSCRRRCRANWQSERNVGFLPWVAEKSTGRSVFFLGAWETRTKPRALEFFL